MNSTTYTPPPTAEIARSQNELGNLQLLLVQRRLHSAAKRWAYLRLLGLGGLAVAAPIVGAILPEYSVGIGATAAIWFILSRTLFIPLERKASERGAFVQELFDRGIYRMPSLGARRVSVTPEEISHLGGDSTIIRERAVERKLNDWYPLDMRLEGTDAIAIAQRANAAYSDRLLAWNANIWLGLILLWSLMAISLSLILDFSLEKFLVSVALPVMPPLLDTYDEWLTVRNAGKERRALAQAVQDKIADPSHLHVPSRELLLWQDQLFVLRRESPQVPNFVYAAMRDSNERAMNEAAANLAEIVLSKTPGGAL